MFSPQIKTKNTCSFLLPPKDSEQDDPDDFSLMDEIPKEASDLKKRARPEKPLSPRKKQKIQGIFFFSRNTNSFVPEAPPITSFFPNFGAKLKVVIPPIEVNSSQPDSIDGTTF